MDSSKQVFVIGLGLLILSLLILYVRQEQYLSSLIVRQNIGQNIVNHTLLIHPRKKIRLTGSQLSKGQGNNHSAGLVRSDQKQQIISQIDQWDEQTELSNKEQYTDGSNEQTEVKALSKELAWEHARDNVVVVTWCNLHFVDFAINWARRLQHLDMNNYLVGAMDQSAAEILVQKNINTFRMYQSHQNGTGLGEGDFQWGSSTFHQMGRQKIGLLLTFIEFGLDIFLCDVDTVMLSDPTDYFGNFPEADILTSSDHLRSTIPEGDKGLEMPPAGHSALNIGVMFFRHSNATVSLISEWVRRIEADEKLWDQEAFGRLVRQGWRLDLNREDRLFSGFNGTVMVGILPVAAFASGHTYFVQKLYEVMKVEPIVVHCTFQYGGVSGKRNRLREAGLWWEEENQSSDYYSGGFVEINLQQLQINYTEDSPVWDVMDFHLQNIQYQLLQIKQLLAVSVALNRTAIMPPMQCHCDRYWGPVEKCRIPGAVQTRLPFTCPLDHIMEPFHFDDKPEVFGTPIRMREYSFLEQEQTPAKLKQSVLQIQPDESKKEEGPQMFDLDNGKALMIPANATDRQLQQYLAPYIDDYRVFQFNSPLHLLSHFEDVDVEDSFIRRIAHIPGFWCCRGESWPHRKGGTPYAPMILGKGIEYRE